ncbi:helix-turn-helix domain-containing protein, partial [Streptomyces niveus]
MRGIHLPSLRNYVPCIKNRQIRPCPKGLGHSRVAVGHRGVVMGARKPNAGQRPSARQMLAKELARLREESGKSLATLGEETTYDRAYLHKLETGARVGS